MINDQGFSPLSFGTGPLLTTRLTLPRASHTLVQRQHLLERLDEVRRLILITAPPGFGKTTLLAEWLRQAERLRVAWLSLDAGDNDPVRFLTYLVGALRTVVPEVGATTLAQLEAPQLAPVESLLIPLLNDLSSLEQTIVLALDDYHVIEAETVHRAIAFLLEHAPPQLRLALASRTMPPLPLARLRAQGELVEVRLSDLRFSRDQAAAFLSSVMGLDLPPDVVAALDARTEGWVAGLQLAALSMRGRDDVQGFLAAFTGSHRFVLDYLSDEVLRRQTPQLQSFLLKTSLLDRMCADLCDAIVAVDTPLTTSSYAILDELEQANLFLVPLDDERRWFRYHQLFADVLRARLRQTQPAFVPVLHQRASDWLAAQGFLNEAVSHAMAALDWERAASLVERAARPLLLRSEVTTLLGWLRALPDPVLATRPQLGIFYAWALVAIGQLDAVEPRLRVAEQALPADSTDLRGELLAVRVALAGLRRDQPQATIALAQQALALLSDEKAYVRGLVALMLGAAHFQQGNLDESAYAFNESSTVSQAAGNLLIALFALRQLAEIALLRGQLQRAEAIYREALRLAEERHPRRDAPGRTPLPAAGVAYVGLGDILAERDQLVAAAELMRVGIALGEQASTVELLLRGYFSLARVQHAADDSQGAAQTLEKAVAAARATNVTRLIAWASAERTLQHVRQGELAAAVRWMRESGLQATDQPAAHWEREYTVLARVLLALGRSGTDPAALPQALALLERLLVAAEAAGRTGSAIELLVLQALAHTALGHETEARATLERALALAEPEGYIRVFTDEGPPMMTLLRSLTVGTSQRSLYVQQLLGSLLHASSPAVERRNAEEVLPDALSERELEVLHLIAAGLSNQEIADRLVVAISTVKKHINSIYGKLDVRSRTQALLRARELGLLA